MNQDSKKEAANTVDQATLHRRAEKGWRHRDVERSWTHFVWTLLVTGQTMLLGIFAIVASIAPDTYVRWPAVLIFIFSAVPIIICLRLSFQRRNIESSRASHFENSVKSGEQSKQDEYDNTSADSEFKKAEKEFSRSSKNGEKVSFSILAFTTLMLATYIYFLPAKTLGITPNTPAGIPVKLNKDEANHGAVFWTVVGIMCGAFFTQLLIAKRERGNRRDQMLLELYLDVIDVIMDNELAMAKRAAEGGNLPEELQVKRIAISHRLKLLAPDPIQSAYKSYSHLTFQEIAHDTGHLPENPDEVNCVREHLIKTMKADIQGVANLKWLRRLWKYGFISRES